MTSGRKDCRDGTTPCDPRSIGEALYCQGNHAQMTRSELAEAMDVNPSTLGNWCDHHHDSRIPDERLEHLLRLTDDHGAYARYVAQLQGLVVYDPKAARGHGVTRMVSDFSDLLKAIDTAHVDDAITGDEARAIQREGNQLIAAVDAEIQNALAAAGLTKGRG